MGDMFRSEQMVLAQLFIQPEAAYFTISELGEYGVAQFKDLNKDVNVFQREFVSEVRSCEEMETKIQYIEKELYKGNVAIIDQQEMPKAPHPKEMIELEAHLEKTEGYVKELNQSVVTLKSNFLELIELKHVLEKTEGFFGQQDEVLHSLGTEDASGGQLSNVAGTMNREKMASFEKMLWRVSKGNVFLRRVDIEEPLEDPTTGNDILKTVFVAFFQGDQLKTRINKICTGFRASMYTLPTSLTEKNEKSKEICTNIEDLTMVLNQTQDHLQKVLSGVAKELQSWKAMVRKMKAICHILNHFSVDVSKKCLIGECWVPSRDIPTVQKALSAGSKFAGSSVSSFLNVLETNEEPPTFNRTNKFTRGFQNLIDSYGVASCREANPALYSIITFPFLFAVMFGDIGHAIIMTSFGSFLVIAEKKFQAKKSSSEIFNIFFAGRYIILLMGLFSIYTGIVYNDFFSISMNIFGSSWFVDLTRDATLELDERTLDPRYDYRGTPYFIGIDPAWQTAENKIVFLNSFKMKLSIIFGVVHMIFGVCVSVINLVYFRKYSSIFLEFLPQVCLLCFLFLWMVIMMFLKWIWYSADKGKPVEYGSSCAPSVLIYFINMILLKQQDPAKGCNVYMFDGQEALQRVLLFASIACIPILLLGKPLYIKFKRKSKSYDEEEEPMSEIFIHQAIHTIEYVLSTISHTASYLRLWALSLAHAQLSDVLWSMLFRMGLKVQGYLGLITTFILFIIWAIATLAILVVMEGLSAFLHTLRLHWVEFMSKFYAGLGYTFQPFSFKTILDVEENEDLS